MKKTIVSSTFLCKFDKGKTPGFILPLVPEKRKEEGAPQPRRAGLTAILFLLVLFIPQGCSEGKPATSSAEKSATAGRETNQAVDSHRDSAPSETAASTSPPLPAGTNRLAKESSLYLRRHASNPVDWFPWGEEAFKKAKATDRLIFLSVGYASCHWCRVMEEESFRDAETAKILNDRYVSVKVDREERPDVDKAYMQALVGMTGSGGWPMSVWLTPDLRPILARTFIPREDREGQPGFKTLLNRLASLYADAGSRKNLVEQGEAVFRGVGDDPLKGHKPAESLDFSAINGAIEEFKRQADRVNGGFGGRPKFPSPSRIDALFRAWSRSGDREARDIALMTLRKMAEGGVFDQVGGGFHRYSTDEKWLVPHFEKMLDDNALLVKLYLDAHLIDRDPFFLHVAERALEWMERDLRAPDGGFYSALDADTSEGEGAYYVWTPEQLKRALGPDAGLAMDWYGVTEKGNFEGGASVLAVRDRAGFLKKHQLPSPEWSRKLSEIEKKLLNARSKREKPEADDKILADLNGLAVQAFSRACQVTGKSTYCQTARKTADRVAADLISPSGSLRHTKSLGENEGFLSDYAFFIGGLIDLYETTFETADLLLARDLGHKAVELFYHPERREFLFVPKNSASPLPELREFFESAAPTGQSEILFNLERLALTLDENAFRDPVYKSLLRLQPAMLQRPENFAATLNALDFKLSRAKEIAIAGDPEAPDTRALFHVVYSQFLPNRVIAAFDPDAPGALEIEDAVPLLVMRHKRNGAATAYVCENYACRRPVTDPDDLFQTLNEAL